MGTRIRFGLGADLGAFSINRFKSAVKKNHNQNENVINHQSKGPTRKVAPSKTQKNDKGFT